MYLGLVEGEFKKQRYYNHTQLFRNEKYSNSTTLFSFTWKINETKKETPTLVVWKMIRTAGPYTHITKRCSVCLHEKIVILTCPNKSEILNKRSELVSKCRHGNKFLLETFNNND